MWQAAMEHARSLGHQVRVLVSDYRQPGVAVEQDPDVHRSLRWYWDLDRYQFPRLSPLERLSIERHNAAELARHLRELQPDVVSWWSMGCMSLAMIEQVRRAGIPASFVVHDDWLVYGPHYDQWIRMWRGWRNAVAPAVERVSGIPTEVDLSAAGRFVFNSRYTFERAREAGIAPPVATVVYPGIDERFLTESPPEPWRWRLACVGRIDRQKGVDVAIRAVARLPKTAALSIWGTGDDRYIEEMRRLAAKLGVGDRVRFEGWADPDRLTHIYADADAVLFPVRWEEPFGLVPLEAMGVGRPVVSTARGGTTEFVRDGDNALVFTVDDDAALSDAILRLGEDAGLRERLRDGGRRTAATFTLAEFADRTVEEILRAAVPGQASASTPA
jgi:glycosyltransferase involved in cell wall biosynthesis